jgi:hypothetical protein
MKTKLPSAINTVKEAKSFLWELHSNGEAFHCEDDANDCLAGRVTKEQGDLLNKLMEDIYNLQGNDGRHVDLAFDPCQFLLDIDIKFRYKDLSGRGFKGKRSYEV